MLTISVFLSRYVVCWYHVGYFSYLWYIFIFVAVLFNVNKNVYKTRFLSMCYTRKRITFLYVFYSVHCKRQLETVLEACCSILFRFFWIILIIYAHIKNFVLSPHIAPVFIFFVFVKYFSVNYKHTLLSFSDDTWKSDVLFFFCLIS